MEFTEMQKKIIYYFLAAQYNYFYMETSKFINLLGPLVDEEMKKILFDKIEEISKLRDMFIK